MTPQKLEKLRRKAADLPPSPGVYLMKRRDGTILYVGKSRHLCNRVASYFTGNRHTEKTRRMVAQVEDFDTIVCDTEMEALSLENTLIKRHSPKYNIRLKDAKSYPYIKLEEGPFPRLTVTRNRQKNGTYFGPYPGAAEARANCETVGALFGLINCNHSFPKEQGRVRPCLYRDTGRCIAPCTGEVTPEEYARLVASAVEVLEGGVRRVSEALKEEMLRLAEEEQFEAAARVRDRIRALGGLGEKQKVVGVRGEDTDVWGLAATEVAGALAVLTVRDGTLITKNEYTFPRTEILDGEGAVAFIADYYERKGNCPPSVMLGFSPAEDDVSLLGEYLTLLAHRRVKAEVPKRGEKNRLALLAEKNAAEAVEKIRTAAVREDGALVRLSTLLGLEVVPDRVEAYDISNLGEEFPTASMVVWEDGRLARNRYRTFRIRDSVQNDYAAMEEALHRRFTHEGGGFEDLPDLLLVDGGAGHVCVAKRVLSALDVNIPVFGMVKDDHHKTRALTDGEGEVNIGAEQDVYAFIYNLQEEAHRFAVSHVQRAKRKTLKRSSLEAIPGVGPARAKLLLSSFGTLAALKAASWEELVAVKGVSRPAADAVYAHFHKKNTDKK